MGEVNRQALHKFLIYSHRAQTPRHPRRSHPRPLESQPRRKPQRPVGLLRRILDHPVCVALALAQPHNVVRQLLDVG